MHDGALVIDAHRPPWFARNVAAVYRAVALLLSTTTRTSTPRLWAASRAVEIGFEVNEYAATRMPVFEESMVLTTRSVAPPFGEKATSMAGETASTVAGSNREADNAAMARSLRTVRVLQST